MIPKTETVLKVLTGITLRLKTKKECSINENKLYIGYISSLKLDVAESQAQSFAIVEGNKCLPRAFLSWEIGFDSLILRYCDLEKKF